MNLANSRIGNRVAESAVASCKAVRNPEQKEMVKKFNAAQEIFNDSSRPYELRKAQYDETMRDFHALKNKISGF